MSQEMIEVTKPDGSKHIVPAGNAKQYKAHNARHKDRPDFKEKHELKWGPVGGKSSKSKKETK